MITFSTLAALLLLSAKTCDVPDPVELHPSLGQAFGTAPFWLVTSLRNPPQRPIKTLLVVEREPVGRGPVHVTVEDSAGTGGALLEIGGERATGSLTLRVSDALNTFPGGTTAGDPVNRRYRFIPGQVTYPHAGCWAIRIGGPSGRATSIPVSVGASEGEFSRAAQ